MVTKKIKLGINTTITDVNTINVDLTPKSE